MREFTFDERDFPGGSENPPDNVVRACPGLPGHAPGPCPWPAMPGDRYCGGCRAEFDNTPNEGWGTG